MPQKLRFALSGAAAGLVCGLFGAGGGMVLVPLLLRFCKLESRTVFASALSIMLPISLVSLAVCALSGGLPLRESLPYLGGVILAALGAWISSAMSAALLRRLFGVFLLFVGISELRFKTRGSA